MKRFSVFVFLIATTSIAAVSLVAQAGTISGKVSGVSDESVVYVDTIAGKTFAAPTQHPVMDQKDLMFHPHILAVQQGTTVDFLNSDSVAHTVFWISVDGNKKLGHNLGTWPKGEKRSFKFDNPGAIPLASNVHPEVAGYIVVSPTPYFAVTDKSGNYKIDNVPDGSYTVVSWQEGANNQSKLVAVAGDTKTDFTPFATNAAAQNDPAEQEKRRREEAAKESQKIIAVNKLLAQATQMSQAGNHEGAVQILTQATQELPENAVLWARLGDLELLAGKTSTERTKATKFYQDAFTHFGKAIDINPNPPSDWYDSLREAGERSRDNVALSTQDTSGTVRIPVNLEPSSQSPTTTAGAKTSDDALPTRQQMIECINFYVGDLDSSKSRGVSIWEGLDYSAQFNAFMAMSLARDPNQQLLPNYYKAARQKYREIMTRAGLKFDAR